MYLPSPRTRPNPPTGSLFLKKVSVTSFYLCRFLKGHAAYGPETYRHTGLDRIRILQLLPFRVESQPSAVFSLLDFVPVLSLGSDSLVYCGDDKDKGGGEREEKNKEAGMRRIRQSYVGETEKTRRN